MLSAFDVQTVLYFYHLRGPERQNSGGSHRGGAGGRGRGGYRGAPRGSAHRGMSFIGIVCSFEFQEN